MRAAVVVFAFILSLATVRGARADDIVEPGERGAELLQQGKTSQAIDEFLKAIELNPKDTDPRFQLAAIYEREGRLDEAIYHYEKIVSAAPRNATAHNNLGVLYDHKGRSVDSIREFEATLEIDPQNALAAKNVETARKKQSIRQESERQIAAAKEAAEAKPDNPTALYSLARTYAFYGDRQQAIASLEKALKLGFHDLAYIKTDSALDSLREDPDYQRALAGR
jgi:tetratricopeptide (TPR) repeat protein